MNGHASEDSLELILQKYQNKVIIGNKYHHYKSPSQHYKVLNIGLNEITETPCVIYKALYGKKLVWVRDIENWLELVNSDDGIVPRFTCLN